MLLGASAWFWFQQEHLLFNPVLLPAQTALSRDPDVKEVWVNVPGARLSGLHLQQAHAKGLVFFLHGNAGNLQTWFTNPAFYRQAGFDLFMIDYRGFGKSTGRIESEAQLRADVQAAWNQVAPQYRGKKMSFMAARWAAAWRRVCPQIWHLSKLGLARNLTSPCWCRLT